jgi:hypothetical protein
VVRVVRPVRALLAGEQRRPRRVSGGILARALGGEIVAQERDEVLDLSITLVRYWSEM